ncbi:uncharacterized protein LOC130647443 [Hydractinia symbiolongicarpus]|uniref:uncharacterized protein LOC130647443 n=1 Tax=Hydractinia symbiolongicarpus TaxID=13093 RepID=UPI00254E058E|nr:uncharacterized protein LOC130647443 [Hydractinia symbiolongicarpus]
MAKSNDKNIPKEHNGAICPLVTKPVLPTNCECIIRSPTFRSVFFFIFTGRPKFCDIKYEYEYDITESTILTVAPKVCGYPIPKLKWEVGEDNFSTASNFSVINNAIRQYEYSFNTRPITREDCGRNLALVTSNTIGSMKRNAKIYVEFVPSLVSNVLFYRHNASCVRVTWDGEDTGKCSITYHLQFSGRETIYTTSKTDLTLCNSSDIDVVFIWASYNRNIGVKLASRIITTTSSPDNTSTRTITATNTERKVARTCDHQFTSNIITAIVTLVISLILNTIIFVIFKHKGFIIVNMIRTRPPQSSKDRSTNDYGETGKMISHYADINSKAVKPSIYADLTPTTDHSKQYYEIELNTLQSNIYANITT